MLAAATVVDTVSVRAILAGMYRTGTYTGIEMPTFSTGLNTGHTGYVLTTGQFRAIPTSIGHIG